MIQLHGDNAPYLLNCVVLENIHTPDHRGSLEILRREGGGLKTKLFKGKYEPELEFQRGGGSNQKKPLWGWEYGYFLEQNISQAGLAMEYLAQGHSILTEHSEVCMLMQG